MRQELSKDCLEQEGQGLCDLHMADNKGQEEKSLERKKEGRPGGKQGWGVGKK